MILVLRHHFTPWGRQELFCRKCGYVIWKVETPAAAIDAIKLISGGKLVGCGGDWGQFIHEPL